MYETNTCDTFQNEPDMLPFPETTSCFVKIWSGICSRSMSCGNLYHLQDIVRFLTIHDVFPDNSGVYGGGNIKVLAEDKLNSTCRFPFNLSLPRTYVNYSFRIYIKGNGVVPWLVRISVKCQIHISKKQSVYLDEQAFFREIKYA